MNLVGAAVTALVGRSNTEVSYGLHQSKTNDPLFVSALFSTKSICSALFSTFSGAHVCERRVHLVIKGGEQPLPNQKSMSLNVSLSRMGFFHKANLKLPPPTTQWKKGFFIYDCKEFFPFLYHFCL